MPTYRQIPNNAGQPGTSGRRFSTASTAVETRRGSAVSTASTAVDTSADDQIREALTRNEAEHRQQWMAWAHTQGIVNRRAGLPEGILESVVRAQLGHEHDIQQYINAAVSAYRATEIRRDELVELPARQPGGPRRLAVRNFFSSLIRRGSASRS